MNEQGNTKGGSSWKNLTTSGLKAFKALALCMGLKVQPNYKTYWMKDYLFRYPVISNVFTRARFQELRRCLHVTHMEVIDRDALGYDKIGQTWWLVDGIGTDASLLGALANI